jgi:hypothetical protein
MALKLGQSRSAYCDTGCVSESGDFARLFFSGSATLERTFVSSVLNWNWESLNTFTYIHCVHVLKVNK